MFLPNNLIVVCAGADAVRAEQRGLPRLLLCLGLGKQGLRRLSLPAHTAGCYLGLSDLGLESDPPSSTAAAIVTEARRMQAAGVLADFERRTPPVSRLLTRLDEALAKAKLPFYVPLTQAENVTHASLLADTAISGGSLYEYFSELLARYPGRIAANLRPVSADFCLPSADSEGKSLSPAELQALQEKVGAQTFFSRELCAKYFTYMDAAGAGHFVLFDDTSTLSAKLQTLQQLGAGPCFALYPDIAGMLSGD